MPANISINFNTSSADTLAASLVDARFASQDSMSLAKNFPAGALAGQVDLIFERRGAAESTPEEIDLSLVADQNGDLSAFASVKALAICNKGEENPLEVSGSYFGSNAKITVPPGGALALLLPDGVEITPSSNDIISVGSVLGTEYEARIVGVKVPQEALE